MSRGRAKRKITLCPSIYILRHLKNRQKNFGIFQFFFKKAGLHCCKPVDLENCVNTIRNIPHRGTAGNIRKDTKTAVVFHSAGMSSG